MIEAEKANYSISWMCKILSVPRSSFYEWRSRVGQVTATAQRREELKVNIKNEFDLQRGTAGCRRVTVALNELGIACSIGLVADLMREMGLKAIQPRAWRKTTISDEEGKRYPDLIGRDFSPESADPGERLVGDITYLRTGAGWVYLAVVIDLATRMVVGWQMADNMRTPLVVDALKMARDHGHVTKQAIFHSDHGSQYTSKEFAKFCKKSGIRQSMGRTGVCWDNAAAESFFSSLKNEMYHQSVFETRERARFAVADYIEVFYNRVRRHSSIGYRTPTQEWDDRTPPSAMAA